MTLCRVALQEVELEAIKRVYTAQLDAVCARTHKNPSELYSFKPFANKPFLCVLFAVSSSKVV
jgi:hypothetical protein